MPCLTTSRRSIRRKLNKYGIYSALACAASRIEFSEKLRGLKLIWIMFKDWIATAQSTNLSPLACRVILYQLYLRASLSVYKMANDLLVQDLLLVLNPVISDSET
jgi:hypothetical protein